MIICSHCFKSFAIQEYIEAKAIIGDCPTCNQKSVEILDTDKSYYDDLVEWFEELLNIFTPAEDLPHSFPKAQRRMLSAELHDGWNIFSPNLRESDVYQILTAICHERYEIEPNKFDKPVGIKECFNPDFLHDHSLLREGSWEQFVEDIKHKNRYHSKHINLDMLEKVFSFLHKVLKEGDIFYRARISDATPLAKEQMGPPEPLKSSAGRANAAGIACMYLADSVDTTIYETRAGAFDFVSVAEFRLKQDISVVNLGAIATLCPVGIDMDYLDFAVNKACLEKINHEIGKAMRLSDSPLDYIATQYICDFVKTINGRDSNGNSRPYSGILYNSTIHANGLNLAAFNKDIFQCEEVKCYHVDNLEYKYR